MVEIASGYFYHEPIIELERTEWISETGSSLKCTEAGLQGYFMLAILFSSWLSSTGGGGGVTMKNCSGTVRNKMQYEKGK